jgi:hypothetical protein
VATKITRIQPLTTPPFPTLDSFSYLRIEDPGSLAEVLAIVNELRAADGDARYLFTLDDLDQCHYRSMHASERLLADGFGYSIVDVDWDDPESAAAYHLATLQHVLARLEDPAQRAFREVAGTLRTAPEDIEVLADINEDPDQVLDDVVFVQRLPVARDDLLIAGLPNGYFRGDWNTRDNHAIIRHLAQAYGYRFASIGATLLGFVRDQPIDPAAATALTNDLAILYGQPQPPRAWARLGDAAQRNTVLLLGYTEDFSELPERGQSR